MSKIAVNEITDEVGTGSPTFTNGLAQSDIAGALNATGTAPIYACRAWVNFDGTTATIRDSGNVSSITKDGTGQYTVNFATSMPDVNYCVSANAEIVFGVRTVNAQPVDGTYNVASVQVLCAGNTTDAGTDTTNTNVAIFR